MIVASSRELGKADVLVKLAEDLGSFVRQAVREGASLDCLERGAFRQVLEMGHAAVDLFLDAQGDGDLGESVTTAEGTVLYRSDTPMTRPLRTIFGEHSFAAFVYAPGQQTKDRTAAHRRPHQSSRGQGFLSAARVLAAFLRRKGVRRGRPAVRDRFSSSGCRWMSSKTSTAPWASRPSAFWMVCRRRRAEEGAILVVTADGKGVPLVQADAQQVPVFEEKERPGNRRMATLGCVYTVDPHVRTPEQIVAALFRDETVSQPANRPEPQGKHYRGYFAEPAQADEEAVPSAYRTWAWIAQEVTARRQPGQAVVRLMDGQQSLWDAADACLEEFVEDLRQAGEFEVLVDILDIIHVSSYVWKAAKAFYGHKEHQEAFVQDRLLRILQGEVAGVITGMRRMASQRDLQGQALKEVTRPATTSRRMPSGCVTTSTCKRAIRLPAA